MYSPQDLNLLCTNTSATKVAYYLCTQMHTVELFLNAPIIEKGITVVQDTKEMVNFSVLSLANKMSDSFLDLREKQEILFHQSMQVEMYNIVENQF